MKLKCSRSLCGSRVTVGITKYLDECRKLESVSAAIARGKRPVPFRTRKLSLSASMVLQGGPCGRVDRRRTSFIKASTPLVHESETGMCWGLFNFCTCIKQIRKKISNPINRITSPQFFSLSPFIFRIWPKMCH